MRRPKHQYDSTLPESKVNKPYAKRLKVFINHIHFSEKKIHNQNTSAM